MAKIVCPQCKTRFTIPLSGSSDVTCPKCRAEFDMAESAPPVAAAPAKPKKEEKPKPEAKPKAKVKAFLNACPVCTAGQVVAKKAGDDERFVCTHCSSVMEQTIYGYTYVQIDPQFKADKGDLLHESLTKDDLDFMVQAAGGKDNADSTDFAGTPAVAGDRVSAILGGSSDDEPASSDESLLDDILDDEADKPRKGKSLTASKKPKAGLLDDILDDEAGASAKAAPKPAESRRSKTKKKRRKVLMWQVDEERLERRRRKRNLGSSAMLPRVRTKSRASASDAGDSSDSGEPEAKLFGVPLDASDEALAVATAPDDTGSEMEAAAVGSSAQMAAAASSDEMPAAEGSSLELPAASAGSSDEAPAAAASSAESLAAASAESSGDLPQAEPASAEAMPAVGPAPPAPAPALAGVVVLAVALAGICALRAAEGVFTKLGASGTLSKLGAGYWAWQQDLGTSGLVGATRAIVGRNRDAFDRFALLVVVAVLAWRLAVASRALDYLCRTSPTAGDRTRGSQAINTFLLLLFAGGTYALAVTCGASSLAAAPLLLVCSLVASVGWMMHVRALLPKIERRRLSSLSVWIMSNAACAIVVYLCAKGVQVGGASYNGVEAAAIALWLNATVNWQCASGTLGDEEASARPRWPITAIALLASAIAAVALCA